MWRRTKLLIAVAVYFGVASCATLPQGHWHRASDGKRVDADPKLFQQFAVDDQICKGEAAKARLAAGDEYSLTAIETVYRGCQYSKGYLIKP